MTKVEKEASRYKNSSVEELRKVIKSYKRLSRSNSDMYNFLFTFIIMMVSAYFLIDLTFGYLLGLLLFHYLFFWEYLHKYKKLKLVSDSDKEEIDEIISILEKYLESRENKKPL
jgi:Ca2+/Na+ antiporter